MSTPALTPSLAHRFDRLDALRGLAMVWMTIYHFAFDLNYFKFIRQNFYTDPVWTWQRASIVSLFVFCAGLSVAVALHQGQSWPRFWRRWGQIAACALLVSAGSYLMFPKSWIYFGVLHGLALMLIVGRLAALSPTVSRWLWLLGALAIAAAVWGPNALTWCLGNDVVPALNSRAWNWLGLVTQKPVTEDYVPLLPWLGAMFWGIAAGRWVLVRQPAWMSGRVGLAKPLAFMGRWSLSYYMLHQPMLIGLLMLAGGRMAG